MFNIAGFLEKFKNVTLTARAPKKALIQSAAHYGIPLLEEEITIRDGVAYGKVHPAIKNQLFLKKSFVLEDLKKDPFGKIITDIR